MDPHRARLAWCSCPRRVTPLQYNHWKGDGRFLMRGFESLIFGVPVIENGRQRPRSHALVACCYGKPSQILSMTLLVKSLYCAMDDLLLQFDGKNSSVGAVTASPAFGLTAHTAPPRTEPLTGELYGACNW